MLVINPHDRPDFIQFNSILRNEKSEMRISNEMLNEINKAKLGASYRDTTFDYNYSSEQTGATKYDGSTTIQSIFKPNDTIIRETPMRVITEETQEHRLRDQNSNLARISVQSIHMTGKTTGGTIANPKLAQGAQLAQLAPEL